MFYDNELGTRDWLMDKSEARDECQESWTVAHVLDKCVAFSDQRYMYLSPPYTLKKLL